MEASKQSKSSTEASSSQTHVDFDLKEMIVEESRKIMENIEEVWTPMNSVW